MDFNKWNPFWATCFVVLAFLIIVGNSLTIATLLRRKFRKGSHLLLISLAVADLLVGCTIPPSTVGMDMLSHKPEILLFIWPVSLFVIVSSVFHLPLISLERLHATLRPFRHRQLTRKVYWAAIATPWIISASFVIPRFALRRFIQPSDEVFFVIAFATTPLLITCFSYFVIWKKTRQSRDRVKSFRQKKEARFLRIILTVTAASFATWLPFQLYKIVVGLSPNAFLPFSVTSFISLLQFSNSFVNFVVYFLRFPDYRKALIPSVCRIAPRHETITTPLPPPQLSSDV
ncbi:PREDICTED: probable G-protein coupled receptor 19 [Acropora digitifera]|uniref:probable G-protein coupled receptor 19 n=1 Tax=Acropora digitifera TaxID=70779 RepID=UPI00077B1942|nr:PREDICTED: probable G-protein coupled receptor 19 [Acropora digitifera]